jgi:50S ribosomal subunit-associated GTPase HflX
LNKADRVFDAERPSEAALREFAVQARALDSAAETAVAISALRKWGLDELLGVIEERLSPALSAPLAEV